jgi:uncharacterized membrane protein
MSKDPTSEALLSIEKKQALLEIQLKEAQNNYLEIQSQITALKQRGAELASDSNKAVPESEKAIAKVDEKTAVKSAPLQESKKESLPTPPPIPQPQAEEKTVAQSIVASDGEKLNLELKIGQTWFVRLGLLSLITGLIFLSNYAYKNWLFGASAEVKSIVFFTLSLALSATGMRLEKRNEKLKHYGRALTAGGLATAYYTLYATHFTESLYCISSPIIAGLLLTAWAGIMLAYAVWKRSQIVSILATSLAFYGTIVNPAGGLSLFSALLLSASGVFLFSRYRWVSVGFTTLIAAYASHAFWLSFYPQQTSPLLEHAYLISYWLIFSSSLFIKRKSSDKSSALFAALNNAAFWFLTCFSLPSFSPVSHFSTLSAGIALLYFSCFAFFRKSHASEVAQTFLYQGLFLITLAILTEFSGAYRFIILGAEALLLLAAAHRSKSSWIRLCSGLVYLLSIITGLIAYYESMPPLPSFIALFVLSAVYTGGLRFSLTALPNNTAALALIPSLTSYGVLVIGVLQHTPEQLQLLLSSLLFAGFWALYIFTKKNAWIRDIASFAPLALIITTGLCLYGEIPAPQTLGFCLPIALLFFWYYAHDISVLTASNIELSPAPEWSDKKDFGSWLLAILTAVSLAYVFNSHLTEHNWIYGGALVALLGNMLGAWCKRDSLSVSALLFHGISLHYALETSDTLWSWIAACLLALQIFYNSTWGRSEWSIGIRNILGTVLAIQLTNACYEHPYILTLLAALSFLWAISMRSHGFAACCSYILLTISACIAADAQYDWEGLKYIPIVIALLLYTYNPVRDLPAHTAWKVIKNTAKILTLLVLTIVASMDTVQLFHSNGLSVCWALLAATLLASGIFLKDKLYRLAGLLIFSITIMRVAFVDVMALNTLGRILSFIALGLTLMSTGYLYNRFSERIRKLL